MYRYGTMTTRYFTDVGRYVGNHIPTLFLHYYYSDIYIHKHTVLSLKYDDLTIVINFISLIIIFIVKLLKYKTHFRQIGWSYRYYIICNIMV